MNENVNLDSLVEGLEAWYFTHCRKYSNEHEMNVRKRKKNYIMSAICFLIFFLLLVLAGSLNVSPDVMYVIVFLLLFTGVIIIIRTNLNNVYEKSREVEKNLLQFLQPNIQISNKCPEHRNMKNEFFESNIQKKICYGYDASDYYTYALADKTIVEGANLCVYETNINETKIWFSGEFICIKNKHTVEHRIDIVPEDSTKQSNMLLDYNEFESMFKVFCEDKLYAYRFLTSDTMTFIMDFCKTTKHNVEITLVNDSIYIKVSGANRTIYSNSLVNPFKKETILWFSKEFLSIRNFVKTIYDKTSRLEQ